MNFTRPLPHGSLLVFTTASWSSAQQVESPVSASGYPFGPWTLQFSRSGWTTRFTWSI